MRSGSLLVLACCAANGPDDVLRAYAAAVEAGDAERIWELSDDRFRASHSKEELVRHLAERREERARLVTELSGRAAERAEVALSAGPLVLIRAAEGWRIAAGGLELFDPSTPEGALAGFLEATANGRLDVVRSLMPARHARAFEADDALSAHLEAIASRVESARRALAAAPAKAAEVDGDRARIPYGGAKAVTLVREAGRWKVVDLE
jgi:hypothetical protein